MTINTNQSLEEICFLWEKHKVICRRACDGHNTQCKRYIRYKPLTKPYIVDAKYQSKMDRKE